MKNKPLVLAALLALSALTSGCSSVFLQNGSFCMSKEQWRNHQIRAANSSEETINHLVKAGFEVSTAHCGNDVLYIRLPGCNPARINCSVDYNSVKFEKENGKKAVNHLLNKSLDNEFDIRNYSGIAQYYSSLNLCK